LVSSETGFGLGGLGLGLGLGHVGWYDNFFTYHHDSGRSYRYVLYDNYRCYEDDWCGRSRNICFDDSYNEVRVHWGTQGT
jgi:hypothetical protein